MALLTAATTIAAFTTMSTPAAVIPIFQGQQHKTCILLAPGKTSAHGDLADEATFAGEVYDFRQRVFIDAVANAYVLCFAIAKLNCRPANEDISAFSQKPKLGNSAVVASQIEFNRSVIVAARNALLFDAGKAAEVRASWISKQHQFGRPLTALGPCDDADGANVARFALQVDWSAQFIVIQAFAKHDALLVVVSENDSDAADIDAAIAREKTNLLVACTAVFVLAQVENRVVALTPPNRFFHQHLEVAIAGIVAATF